MTAAGGTLRLIPGATGAGRIVCLAVGADDVLGQVRTTRVVLAAAHRDHDTANNATRNLAAFCQRCHMLHDRPEHQAAAMAHPVPEEGAGRPVPRALPRPVAQLDGPGGSAPVPRSAADEP